MIIETSYDKLIEYAKPWAGCPWHPSSLCFFKTIIIIYKVQVLMFFLQFAMFWSSSCLPSCNRLEVASLPWLAIPSTIHRLKVLGGGIIGDKWRDPRSPKWYRWKSPVLLWSTGGSGCGLLWWWNYWVKKWALKVLNWIGRWVQFFSKELVVVGIGIVASWWWWCKMKPADFILHRILLFFYFLFQISANLSQVNSNLVVFDMSYCFLW